MAMVILLFIFFSLGFLNLFVFSSCKLKRHHQHGLIASTSNYSPPSYPVIGCLMSFYQNRHRIIDWYTDLLSKSPTQTIVVQRFGARRTIVTANPANVEYMLKDNFHNYPKGKPFTELLGDLLGYGIFNVDGYLWSTQRKLASHEFSTKSLREFIVKTLDEEVNQRLVPLLEWASRTGYVLDLQEILRRFAFDTICKVSLGTDPCCLDLSRPLPPLVEAFEKASEICAKRSTAPLFLVWKLKRAFNMGSEKTLKESVRLVHESVLEIIHNKKMKIRQAKCDSDLLSRLLEAGHSEELIRDMVISFIMAGRDTTSASMTWMFWLLSEHPSKREKIVDEVKAIFGDGKNPFHHEGLRDMNYLKACICESMRLYPPVVWDSKHAVNMDMLPDGTVVRKGDRVTYFPYGMGRMEEVWGKDWNEFEPDRWFDEDNKKLMKTVSPFKFPVFQAGPRVCLGKEMAFIQMKYVVAAIVSRFVVTPVSKTQPVLLPLLTAHMAGGLKVTVKRRRLMKKSTMSNGD